MSKLRLDTCSLSAHLVSETLSQKILETTLQEVTDEQMIQIIHALAIDILTSDDDRFNVKGFFLG